MIPDILVGVALLCVPLLIAYGAGIGHALWQRRRSLRSMLPSYDKHQEEESRHAITERHHREDHGAALPMIFNPRTVLQTEALVDAKRSDYGGEALLSGGHEAVLTPNLDHPAFKAHMAKEIEGEKP